jgi:hypothetical protein
MNDEVTIKNAYGNIDLPETDVLSAVKARLSQQKHRRRFKVKPAVIIVIILVFSLSATAVAVPALFSPPAPGRSYPPFFTEDGEYVDPMANYQYALEINIGKGDDHFFYTRDEILKMLNAGEIVVQQANIRQPHMHPDPLFYQWWQENICEDFTNGSNAPAGLCDNTFYFLHNGNRACNQCGFIFTEEQNREIGVFD